MRHPVASCTMANTSSTPNGQTRTRRPASTASRRSARTAAPCFIAGRWNGAARPPTRRRRSVPPAAASATSCQPAPRRRRSVRRPHREDLVHLIRNEAEREVRRAPDEPADGGREKPDRVEVATTDIHLPRRIGDALHARVRRRARHQVRRPGVHGSRALAPLTAASTAPGAAGGAPALRRRRVSSRGATRCRRSPKR